MEYVTERRKGGQPGNMNAAKDKTKLWADTIRRAVVQNDAVRLRAIVEAMVTKAEEGDMAAIKEIGDRLDGKAQQSIDADVRGNIILQLSNDDAEL
jgi:hypothetical protein